MAKGDLNGSTSTANSVGTARLVRGRSRYLGSDDDDIASPFHRALQGVPDTRGPLRLPQRPGDRATGHPVLSLLPLRTRPTAGCSRAATPGVERNPDWIALGQHPRRVANPAAPRPDCRAARAGRAHPGGTGKVETHSVGLAGDARRRLRRDKGVSRARWRRRPSRRTSAQRLAQAHRADRAGGPPCGRPNRRSSAVRCRTRAPGAESPRPCATA
jgi:hypothetical protein